MYKKERLEIIDILRGFAMFGVVIVNFFEMNFLPGKTLSSKLPFFSIFDQVSHSIVNLLFVNRAYILFAFLFGYNLFILQQKRAKNPSHSIDSLIYQRLFIIFIFGLVQTSLLWWGTILMVYAVYGFISYLFIKNISRILQFYLALVILFILPVFIENTNYLLNFFSYLNFDFKLNVLKSYCKPDLSELKQLYINGEFCKIITTNLIFWFYDYYALNIISSISYSCQILGLIILGYAAAGYKFLETISKTKIISYIIISFCCYFILYTLNKSGYYYFLILMEN